MLTFIVTGGGNISGSTSQSKPFSVGTSHGNYAKLLQLLKDSVANKVPVDEAAFVNLLDVPKYIFSETFGRVSVKGETVLYDGKPCSMLIASRIVDMASRGLPVTHMLKFLDKLMENPSGHSVQALYQFMENHGIPINSEGNVLAYKSVRPDYKDWYSNTFDNSPGAHHTIPRREVDDNPNMVCSYGIHIGSLEYAENFHGGQKIVICEFNPKDVVSVPCEATENKIRVCEYTVVRDFEGRLDKSYEATPKVVAPEDDEDLDDYEDEEDYDDYEEDEDLDDEEEN